MSCETVAQSEVERRQNHRERHHGKQNVADEYREVDRSADKRFKRDLGAFGRRQPPIMVGPWGIWAYTKMERKEGSK